MAWTWCHSEGVERSYASGIRVGFVDLRRQKLVSRGKQVYAEVYQELLREVQRRYPDRKYILRRLEDWSTPARPPSSSWQNSDSDWLAASFTGLEPTGLHYLKHVAAESPDNVACISYLFTSVYFEECVQLVDYICKTCHSFRRRC